MDGKTGGGCGGLGIGVSVRKGGLADVGPTPVPSASHSTHLVPPIDGHDASLLFEPKTRFSPRIST